MRVSTNELVYTDSVWQTTYYLFEVRKGASSFILRRRYKDFDQLYANLCQSYGKQNVPVPPPKQLLKNENADFLQASPLDAAVSADAALADAALADAALADAALADAALCRRN